MSEPRLSVRRPGLASPGVSALHSPDVFGQQPLPSCDKEASPTAGRTDSVVLPDQVVQAHRFIRSGSMFLDGSVVQHHDVLADRSVAGTLVQRPEHQAVAMPGFELDAGDRLIVRIGERVDPLGDRLGERARPAVADRRRAGSRGAGRGFAGWPLTRCRRARRTIR